MSKQHIRKRLAAAGDNSLKKLFDKSMERPDRPLVIHAALMWLGLS
jgi:hypothetical protein